MSVSHRRLFSLALALLAGAGLWHSDRSVTEASGFITRSALLTNPITAAINSGTVPRYQVAEVTIGHDSTVYSNVWEGPNVNVTFTSPSGKSFVVGGFFYSANTWKARFAPSETGSWSWSVSWTDSEGTQTAQGTFTCTSSAERGWLRRHPTNPFRVVYEDGTLFSGIGIIDCFNDFDGSGSPFDDDWGLDGGTRPAHTGEGRTTSLENYLTAYQGAGFNLFRWSVDNCSFKLWNVISPAGNSYLETQGRWGDQFVASLRQHGFRVDMGVFGFAPAFPNDSADTEKMNAVKRYIKYVVDRYGAYVDFWELMNEASADDEWYRTVAEYMRSIDPYAHAITTNLPRPDLPQIEINSPHWYQSENELQSDSVTVDQIALDKFMPNAQQEPLIYGEQGNNFQNWDPGSALRMRIRSWTAFFSEATLIFWNTSGMTDYTSIGSANIYLGPVERGYIRALQNFTSAPGADVVKTLLQPIDSANIHGYGLEGAKGIYGYFHHFTSHTTSISSTIDVNVPWDGVATWTDPATGTTIQSQNVSIGHVTLTMPSFMVDLALAITPFTVSGLGTITVSPNPIPVCDGSGYGAATVSWTASSATSIEVRMGSPTGQLFARRGPTGDQQTGKWVPEGMVFYLQDVSNGPASPSNTLAVATAHLTTAGCGTNPSGTLTANPNPLTTCDGTGVGQTVLNWSTTNVSQIEIHVDSPSGPLFASGGSSGSLATGKWVSNGMSFYLQNVSGGLPLTAANTLATATVSFSCATSSIAASPNPIPVCGSGFGVTTISWSTSIASIVDVLVGPSLTLFASGSPVGNKVTGQWVSNGFQFVLTNHQTGAQLAHTVVNLTNSCP
jgi:hypothetical protein